MRAVLDANVLVSGLLSRKGPPGQILDAWLDGQFHICLSLKVLEELKRVLQYPRIQQRLRTGQADTLLNSLLSTAEWTEETLQLDVLTRDPSDNIYLACAVEAGADYLVTGNSEHFLEVGNEYQGVQILASRQFLTILVET
jgi:putative PIN family toxin of toxin-antitoxin system